MTLPRFVPKSPKQLGLLRKRLGRAGFYTMQAAVVYSFVQFATPIAFGLIGIMIAGVSAGWMLAIGLAGIGYMLPSFALERLIKKRQKLISNGLPDVLDLLIVCLEAGSGLDQAIVKASDELAIAHPALAEELRFMNTETRAGKPRLEAFRNFAARTGVDDVRALVSMLVQTDRFGTSIAQALRVHAAASRTKRRQRAEERAAKVGVKLVFPLVFCLMPAFYVVTLGPALLDFVQFFGSMK
jgi:tight adherence protein C